MKWVDRFKSLPKSTKNLLIVGVLLALVAALPLFIWAITTQKFLFTQKAQVATGEPTPTPPVSVYPPEAECGWCGGIANIPCEPGLVCRNSYGNVVYPDNNGVCVKPDNTSICSTPAPKPTIYCLKHSPTMAINPQTQGGIPGSTLTYNYTVTNNDEIVLPGTQGATVCQNLPGARIIIKGLPYGWSSSNSSSFIGALPPGRSGSASFTITSPTSPVPEPPGVVFFDASFVNLPGTITIASASASYQLVSTPPTSICTLDAKICPDGSSVGRVPPNCDFAPCPVATPTPPSQSYRNFGILFKFDGVNDDSANGAGVSVIFANPIWGDLRYGTPPAQASYVGNGIYQLRINISILSIPFPVSSQYSIYLKGEKHVGVKFCHASGQTYHCPPGWGAISIPDTSDLISLNFAGVPLPAGDTYTQDGVINQVDFDRITALLLKPYTEQTSNDLRVGDLDYNGRVDVRDMFLLRKSLQVRYDEN